MKKVLFLAVAGMISFSLLALDVKKYASDDLAGLDATKANNKGTCVQKRYADLKTFLEGISTGKDKAGLKKVQDLVDKYCACCASSCTGKGLDGDIVPSFKYKAIGKDEKVFKNILVMWVPAMTYESECTADLKGAPNGKQWFMECAECKG